MGKLGAEKYIGLEISWKGQYVRIVGIERETEKAILAKVNDEISNWYHGDEHRQWLIKEYTRNLEGAKRMLQKAKTEKQKQRWEEAVKTWEVRIQALKDKNTATRKMWIPKSVLEKKLKSKNSSVKEEERKRVSKEDVLKRMRQEIEGVLRREGYTRITVALKEITYELEDLAESVVEGRLSLDEAVERGLRLARQYATPPKPAPPRVPPAVPRVERPPVEVPRRPEEFLSASEAADVIWRDYLGDLFNFGIRYVFENYMRERGMLEQDLGRVAYRLASKVRPLGQRMRREGEEKGIGRLIWASYALTRYAPEIVQFGLLWAMRKIVPEIWPELRLFRNVVEALRGTGIEGSTAKALVGVVYDYAGIPRNKWPEDVVQCYDTFIEAAEKPPEKRRRPLWEYFE